MLNREKMFGFIRRDDGEPDVFFHRSSVGGATFDVLTEDRTKLAFEVVPGREGKGPRAQNVELIAL